MEGGGVFSRRVYTKRFFFFYGHVHIIGPLSSTQNIILPFIKDTMDALRCVTRKISTKNCMTINLFAPHTGKSSVSCNFMPSVIKRYIKRIFLDIHGTKFK